MMKNMKYALWTLAVFGAVAVCSFAFGAICAVISCLFDLGWEAVR